jgi:hypothetical protein
VFGGGGSGGNGSWGRVVRLLNKHPQWKTHMQVSFDEGKLFYKLYAALLSFVNRKLKVIPEQFSDSRGYTALPPETRIIVRDALYKHRDLIDQFVGENPANLPTDELEIVTGWKHALVGQFYIFRYLSKYTIFLSGSPPKAYGVWALADPIEELIGPYLPSLKHAVLLPLKGRIIYDGLLWGQNITFGGGIKRMLNDEYRQAKETFGIITSLPHDESSISKKPVKSKKAKQTLNRSMEAKNILIDVVGLTDAFCKEYLNEEYAEMCRKLATSLVRKRPSPLLKGSPPSWASGIVRIIGRANFLDDPSQMPHMKLVEIDKAFGVGQSTGQNKSNEIRKLLKIHQFDPKWTLPSRMDDNPLVWMLEVNGFLIDIRDAPREAQEIAFEKGLIPYIPADQERTNE